MKVWELIRELEDMTAGASVWIRSDPETLVQPDTVFIDHDGDVVICFSEDEDNGEDDD